MSNILSNYHSSDNKIQEHEEKAPAQQHRKKKENGNNNMKKKTLQQQCKGGLSQAIVQRKSMDKMHRA